MEVLEVTKTPPHVTRFQQFDIDSGMRACHHFLPERSLDSFPDLLGAVVHALGQDPDMLQLLVCDAVQGGDRDIQTAVKGWLMNYGITKKQYLRNVVNRRRSMVCFYGCLWMLPGNIWVFPVSITHKEAKTIICLVDDFEQKNEGMETCTKARKTCNEMTCWKSNWQILSLSIHEWIQDLVWGMYGDFFFSVPPFKGGGVFAFVRNKTKKARGGWRVWSQTPWIRHCYDNAAAVLRKNCAWISFICFAHAHVSQTETDKWNTDGTHGHDRGPFCAPNIAHSRSSCFPLHASVM